REVLIERADARARELGDAVRRHAAEAAAPEEAFCRGQQGAHRLARSVVQRTPARLRSSLAAHGITRHPPVVASRRSNENVDPRRTWLSPQMRPPCASTSSLQIARPSPSPRFFYIAGPSPCQ